MDEKYLVVISGKPHGPFSKEQIRQMDIRPDTFVKKEGMADYKEAYEIEELCQMFGFKQNVTRPQYYATLDTRLLALVIDYLLIFLAYIVVFSVVLSFVESKYLKTAIAVTALPLIPLTKLVLGVFMEASARQGTFGKYWLGLKVTDEEGSRITLTKSLLRGLCKLLSIASLGIGYFIGFFSRKQQCLHDKLAGTLVIRDRLIS